MVKLVVTQNSHFAVGTDHTCPADNTKNFSLEFQYIALIYSPIDTEMSADFGVNDSSRYNSNRFAEPILKKKSIEKLQNILKLFYT